MYHIYAINKLYKLYMQHMCIYIYTRYYVNIHSKVTFLYLFIDEFILVHKFVRSNYAC